MSFHGKTNIWSKLKYIFTQILSNVRHRNYRTFAATVATWEQGFNPLLQDPQTNLKTMYM